MTAASARQTRSASGTMREVELKLRVHPQDLPLLRARLARMGAGRTERSDNIYYDTPDLHLAQCRAALRLRPAMRISLRR